MKKTFERFSVIFPQEEKYPVVAERMEQKVLSAFGIGTPKALLEFWNSFGAGYFGERELYFFSEGDDKARDSLFEWNQKDFWNDVLPIWSAGRPLFFAETSFGE